MTKKINDDELIHMYAKPGRGYTDAELAAYFEIKSRDAIFKRRQKLEAKYPFKETERGRWRIDTEKLLSHITVSQNEALVLYLATRRFSRNTPLAKRYVQAALDKLAPKLHKPMTQKLVQAASKAPEHPHEQKREQLLNELMRAWSEKSAVRLKYRSLDRDESIWHEVSPYLVEPSPWSDSIYIVGHSAATETIIPFSLERIEKAALTSAPFKECDPETEEKLLQYAWGIWRSDSQPELVRLRFSGRRAVRRLRESIWHPEQHIDGPDDNRYAVWQAPIAEWREMIPWIRGWGGDVEVLEPPRLKNAICSDVRRQNRIYGIESTRQNSPEERLLRCWGKTGQSDEDFHPALYHILDVGHVAEQLLQSPASSRWRRVLAGAFDADPTTLINWLPWMVAMHDIGKISVPFQAQNAEQRARLEAEGLSFGRWRPKDKIHHTIVGQIVLKQEFDGFAQLPRRWRTAWLEMVGGHHGEFVQDDIKKAARTFTVAVQEPAEWQELRATANRILQSHFLRQPLETMPEPANVSVAIMALTGFTILCDWLGSDERYFLPHPHTGFFDYIAVSRRKAQEAVAEAGLQQVSRSDAPTTFEALFPSRVPARPLQQAIDAIPDDVLRQPTLAIIEAPTGEGKTEAALALAHRLAQHTGDDEFYCALPTTATSNQMYQRIQQYLIENLGLPAAVNLVHGQAFLVQDDLAIQPLGDLQAADALAWFSPKKKALLAPFAVGTVDQAELAALNVRHNALRLIGLAGKVVILDEVHAYDTYMTTIIEQMLRWLAALGSSVILLSATLPLAKRNALLRAYGVNPDDSSTASEAYPSLWVGSAAGVHHKQPRAYQLQKPYKLHPLHIPHDDPHQKATWLLDAVAEGGNACWITNTVDRAQKLAQTVQELDNAVECCLLHAMFPLDDRSKLEAQIRDKYGPEGERPARSIVIGTQVLEQSLDLDFDVMVSDLAPIDLLLQRMGRLHRHKNERPPRHTAPVLWVNCELNPDDPTLLTMGADRFYTEYILQKTWQTIANRPKITLPDDYRPLVEAVYTIQPPAEDDVLFDAWQKLQKKEDNAESMANERLLPSPDANTRFSRNNRYIFEEDEEGAAWVVAQTRLGAESVTVIPLEKNGDEARLLSTGQTISLTAATDRKTALDLLRQSIRISRRYVVQHFKQSGKSQEALFEKTSLLKNVYPLWLTNNQTTFNIENAKVTLILHPKWGLKIEKERVE